MNEINEKKWYSMVEASRLTGISIDTLNKRKYNPEKWGLRIVKKEIKYWGATGKTLKAWIQQRKDQRERLNKKNTISTQNS